MQSARPRRGAVMGPGCQMPASLAFLNRDQDHKSEVGNRNLDNNSSIDNNSSSIDKTYSSTTITIDRFKIRFIL